MMRPRSLRSRLTLSVVATVAGALVLTTLAFNLVLWNRLSASANNAAYARADAELAALAYTHGHLVERQLPDRVPLAGQAWVFVESQILEQPRVGASLERAAQQFASRPRRQVFRSLPRLHARLYLTPIILERHLSRVSVRQHVARKARAHIGDARAGVVVVAISMRTYETTRNIALVGSVAWALVLLVVVTVAARWTLGAALRPVAEMTAAADTWSATESDGRFGAGKPYDEISQLGATLNRLLDRIAASLRRERRFSAELSHELRTPLARITTEVDLALRRDRSPDEYRDALTGLRGDAHHLTRTLDTLVLAAQQESGALRGRANAQAVVSDTIGTCSALAEERNLTVILGPDEEALWLGVEPDVAAHILEPVLQNACRYGQSEISLSLSQTDSTVAIEIADDGPGVTADEAESIFFPGVRGSAAAAARNGGVGAGLGLSLARRLAEAAQGEVNVVPGPTGLFVISLPTS